ncbi:MAG TPA: mannose-1-phosphate guanylyltransferase [Myxococcota bacterium]|jgi:mannose-1-phosphate guanylyltransferase|nr:mannose-1-phosphate guanylyltransferase [Myxococcota bacterium]
MYAKDHLYALLLAGGKGTRFWPLSREDHPKQLLKLFSDNTLVEETYERILPLVPSDRILIATSKGLAPRLRALFPDLPERNLIVEPVARNTAPCIAVAARRILSRDPKAIIAVLPSDHFVSDRQGFLDIMEAAATHAARGRVVTLGITPTHPETGYGYIRFGEFEADPEHPDTKHRARLIQAFVEKPDHQTAVSYLKAGRYLWNSGIFIIRADTILDKVRAHLPVLADCVERLSGIDVGEDADADAIRSCWADMPDISIDYGVMEKAEGLVVIPSSFGWSDVGTWRALSAFPTDEAENFVYGKVVAVDSSESVLYCSHGMLATLGLHNMVVVVTRGAVLVCPADRTQDVKAVVEELKARNQTEYL